MQTGRGDVVSVSLLQAAVSALVNQATNYLVAGHSPERMGSAHPNIAPYGTLYPTADGERIVLAVGTDRQFQALCHRLGLDGMPDDARFATNADRVEHRDSLDAALRSALSDVKAQEILADLRDANVPAGRVRSMPQVFQQGPAEAMALRPDGHPAGLRQIAFFGGDEGGPLSPPPRYGEHTRRVLHDRLGMADGEITDLVQGSVVDAA